MGGDARPQVGASNGSAPPADSVQLIDALVETGAIGSTLRQLSDRVALPTVRVSAALEALQADGQVLRMGRGLWILSDYERLNERPDFVDPEEFTERFVREGGPGLGTYHGPITFSSNEELPVHRWWPYVQGYSAEFVAGLIRAAEVPRGGTVLDPFSGSGTTLVEGRRAGLRAVGFEILPPAALAARVKTEFGLRADDLRRTADRVIARGKRRRAGHPPFLRETHRQFHPKTLSSLTRLRDALPLGNTAVDRAARVAFGASLIPVSRLRRSPCLGYGPDRPDRAPDPFAEFDRRVDVMREDLAALSPTRAAWGPPAEIHEGDSRSIRLPPGSVDLAVTSPPYVNGMDYVMNYKLDLAWLGYARGYSDLARLRQAMVSCDNLPRIEAARFLSTKDLPDPWLSEILGRIRSNVERKGSYRRQDVHGIVRRYFDDLLPVLRGVYAALAPRGRFSLVVGDSLLAGAYVPGDLILARMGVGVGFRIASVEKARSRRSGQRRSFELRESIVTLEKPGRPRPR